MPIAIAGSIATDANDRPERGGQAAANWMSVIATCKRAGVEPFAYLSDVLRRLPSAKTGAGVRELLPDVWKPR